MNVLWTRSWTDFRRTSSKLPSVRLCLKYHIHQIQTNDRKNLVLDPVITKQPPSSKLLLLIHIINALELPVRPFSCSNNIVLCPRRDVVFFEPALDNGAREIDQRCVVLWVDQFAPSATDCWLTESKCTHLRPQEIPNHKSCLPPLRLGIAHNPMQRARQIPFTPKLKTITDINQHRIRIGLDIDPFSAEIELEAWFAMLDEHCQRA